MEEEEGVHASTHVVDDAKVNQSHMPARAKELKIQQSLKVTEEESRTCRFLAPNGGRGPLVE